MNAPRIHFWTYPGNDALSREYQEYNKRLRFWFIAGFLTVSIIPAGMCCREFGRNQTAIGVAIAATAVYLFYRFFCKIPRSKSVDELDADEYARDWRKWFMLVELAVIAWETWCYHSGNHELKTIAMILVATTVFVYITYRFVRRKRKMRFFEDLRRESSL